METSRRTDGGDGGAAPRRRHWLRKKNGVVLREMVIRWRRRYPKPVSYIAHHAIAHHSVNRSIGPGSTENCNLQNRAIDLSQTKSRMCRKLHYLVHHEYSALPFLRWAFNGARHGSGFRRGSVSPPPPPPTSPLTPLRFSISIDRPRFIGQVYYIIGKKEERRDQRWTRA